MFIALILPLVALFVLLGILASRYGDPAWFLLSIAVAVAFAWLAYRFFRSQQWGYVPFIKLEHGNISFVPSPNTYDTGVHMAPFPPGASLEYRVETGDMYFDGDRGIALARSLWVVEPEGIKKLLVRDFLLFVDFNLALQNLKSVGIPFRVTRVYDGENGEHLETDITPIVARKRPLLPVGMILVGTSSLWLGALARILIRDGWTVIALGTVAFTVLAIATICTSASKRTALLKLVATFPSYAGGYAIAVVCARQFVGK